MVFKKANYKDNYGFDNLGPGTYQDKFTSLDNKGIKFTTSKSVQKN